MIIIEKTLIRTGTVKIKMQTNLFFFSIVFMNIFCFEFFVCNLPGRVVKVLRFSPNYHHKMENFMLDLFNGKLISIVVLGTETKKRT